MALNELYEQIETKASFAALERLSEELPEPVMLLGGWAVYLLVNSSFEKNNGSSYLGSRDVDIGFHIPKDSSREDIETSSFAKSIKVLERMGYFKMGTSRFCKIIHRSDGASISEAEASRYPLYDLFYLYIDPILDHPHPSIRDIFKLTPIDEPLLLRSIEEGRMRRMELAGRAIMVPEPDMLLRMKVSSFPARTKDDKKVKDLCDIYSLIWHSGVPFREVIGPILDDSRDQIGKFRMGLSNELISMSSKYLGITEVEINEVVGRLFHQ